jgi:hypothetical protein
LGLGIWLHLPFGLVDRAVEAAPYIHPNVVVIQGLVSEEAIVLPEDGNELWSHLDLQLTALGQGDLADLGDPFW